MIARVRRKNGLYVKRPEALLLLPLIAKMDWETVPHRQKAFLIRIKQFAEGTI